MFYYFLVWSISVFSFSSSVKWVSCNETNSSNFTDRSSREQAQPMPLLLHLNQSAADILIKEANSIYVSNTTFDDLINNNDTHQLFLRYRERKRQIRLKTIQHEILLKLGFDQEPNITARITEQQRLNLVSSYDRLEELLEMNSTIVNSD